MKIHIVRAKGDNGEVVAGFDVWVSLAETTTEEIDRNPWDNNECFIIASGDTVEKAKTNAIHALQSAMGDVWAWPG